MTKDEALRLALEALEGAYARLVTKCEQNLVTYNGVDVDTLTLSQEAITAIKEVLAQPQPWEKFCDSNCVWTDHHPDCKLAEQESVTWRNAAIRVGEDLCSVGPFGYYDMTAEQWLDWALSVVTVHAPPPQRKPLTDEEIWDEVKAADLDWQTGWSLDEDASNRYITFARAIEAAHGIKGEA